MRHLLNWALSALAVWIVARLVPGFHVNGPLAALIAALVIGFVNATLGVFLKIVTFPLVLLTLGLFWLVINAAMIDWLRPLFPASMWTLSAPPLWERSFSRWSICSSAGWQERDRERG